MMVPLSVDGVEEVAEVVEEVRRPEVGQAAAAAEDPDLEVALSPENPVSLSRRRHNGNVRRLSAKQWPKWPRHLPMVATH